MHTHDLALTDTQAQALDAIDHAIAAMDALASTLPGRVVRDLKRTRSFATTTHLLDGVARHNLVDSDKTGVSLHKVRVPRGLQPVYAQSVYAPGPASETAHAYLSASQRLLDAWAAADAAALAAAQAWARVPGMERTDLTLCVAPRPHLKGIRAAANLAGGPIEPERRDSTDAATTTDWDAPDGPRQRLAHFLSMAPLARNATGVWGVLDVSSVTEPQANHRVRAGWGNHVLMVDAANETDALLMARAIRWVTGRHPFGAEDTTVLSAALFHTFEETPHG
jgi:hypothetical protein